MHHSYSVRLIMNGLIGFRDDLAFSQSLLYLSLTTALKKVDFDTKAIFPKVRKIILDVV